MQKGDRMTTARRGADRSSAADMLPSPRRSQDAGQVLPGRGFAAVAAVLGSQAGLRAAGAPWWTICLLGTFGLAAMCLQIVFPQDSPDRVAWWSERRRYHRRRGIVRGGAAGASTNPHFRALARSLIMGQAPRLVLPKSIFLNKL
jgi:hypothetical protein